MQCYIYKKIDNNGVVTPSDSFWCTNTGAQTAILKLLAQDRDPDHSFKFIPDSLDIEVIGKGKKRIALYKIESINEFEQVSNYAALKHLYGSNNEYVTTTTVNSNTVKVTPGQIVVRFERQAADTDFVATYEARLINLEQKPKRR